MKKPRKRSARPQADRPRSSRREDPRVDSRPIEAEVVEEAVSNLDMVEESSPEKDSSETSRSSRKDGRSSQKGKPKGRKGSSKKENGKDKQPKRTSRPSTRKDSSRKSVKRREPVKIESVQDFADFLLGVLKQFAEAFRNLFGGAGSRGLRIVSIALVLVVFAGLFLYPSVKNYYVAVRETARCNAEYEALKDYHAQLEDEVKTLGSDTGVEDMAHEYFGYVQPGDNAINVEGIEDPERDFDPTEVGIVPSGSIKAPETWYSGVLDPFFGYDG